MAVLVTGGAGYVGSVVAEELLKEGYQVVVLDNLQQGHREAVPPGAEFVLSDICDSSALDELFAGFSFTTVVHMAAETVVEHSMTNPRLFFQDNVVGGMNLLEAMIRHDVAQFIFSSSAAVYGEPAAVPVEEGHAKVPVNSYGESKLMFERILEWYGKAYGVKHISFRYFNAAGASSRLGEDHRPETHLIPNVLRRVLERSNRVPIFGMDYPTSDGTCLRDYVHVVDIAKAHLLALSRIEGLNRSIYNLGNERPYSVLEVVKTAERITRHEIPTTAHPRRRGDPVVLVASSKLAREELGWKPEFPELESIIESAWKWMMKHPAGYGR